MALTLNHLFAVIMLSGAFSLVSAMLFVVMDAVDVAFTEAAVGAGVSTVLMLSTMALTVRIQKETNKPILETPQYHLLKYTMYGCHNDMRM